MNIKKILLILGLLIILIQGVSCSDNFRVLFSPIEKGNVKQITITSEKVSKMKCVDKDKDIEEILKFVNSLRFEEYTEKIDEINSRMIIEDKQMNTEDTIVINANSNFVWFKGKWYKANLNVENEMSVLFNKMQYQEYGTQKALEKGNIEKISKVIVRGRSDKERIFDTPESIQVFENAILMGSKKVFAANRLKPPPYFFDIYDFNNKKTEYFLYLSKESGWIYKNGSEESITLTVQSVGEFNLLLNFIDVTGIVSVTRTGGLPSNSPFKKLDLQNDEMVISKIVELINSCVQRRESTSEEIESLRYGYPTPLTFETKSMGIIRVWNIYKMFHKKNKNGQEITRELYNDRFIMSLENSGAEKYYTAYSKDVVEYLLKGIDNDIPREN